MKKKLTLHLVSLVVFLSIAIAIEAQVTIGSALKANEGSLLDLKERASAAGSANADKGLALPRVVLSTSHPAIGELAKSIGGTGTWDEATHTGLTVYNVKGTSEACIDGANAGIFTWNGTIWTPIFEKKTSEPNTNPNTSTDIYTGANSYILQPNKTVVIPISRGFEIWRAYSGNSVIDGKVLNLVDINLSGNLATSVVWQETSDGANSGVLASTTPVVLNGSGENASLTINSGSKAGNALVNVTVDDKVLWQWHIWVTDTDPQTSSMYNNGKKTYWFMDRSLGATSTLGESSLGLYYQWGRPTPMRKLDNGFTSKKGTISEKDNLTMAIQSPDFITYANKLSHDWYSQTPSQWDSRWGDQNTTSATIKSPFDPCPYGWRVPSVIDGVSPWHCLERTTTGNESNGWNFEEAGRNIGFYPYSGYRSNGTGSLGDVGTVGYVWTASADLALASILHYNSNKVTPKHKYNRANAMSVRCMKEE